MVSDKEIEDIEDVEDIDEIIVDDPDEEPGEEIKDIEDDLEGDIEDGDEPLDVEAEARRMGWKPEADYTGPDGKWVDAETFVSRQENDPRFLRQSLRLSMRRQEKLEKGLDALVAHRDREVKMAEEAAYDKAIREIEAKYKSAVEEGDVDAASEAWKERESLEVEKYDPKKDVVNKWIESNAWYADDPILADWANKYQAMKESQGMPLEESLEATEEYIKRKFPDEFGEKKRTAPKGMSGNRRSGVNSRKTAKPGTYEALNREAKASCDNFVKMMKSRGSKEEEARKEFLSCAYPDMFE